MNVYVATKNLGKLAELRAIFGAIGWRVSTFSGYGDVDEGPTSYAENAALKARALRRQLEASGIKAAVLGDDSGLEIDALGGRPGVLSARYGGPDTSWAQRRSMLLQELAASGRGRGAAFVCALHFIAVDGSETSVIRRLPGEIAEQERGAAGFSYDPIFTYPPLGATFAEMPEDQKNEISHRALAAQALVRALGGTQATTTDAENGASSGT